MKSRKSYCTTPGVGISGGRGGGVSKMLKFFMGWARRCQASFPVPVTGLVIWMDCKFYILHNSISVIRMIKGYMQWNPIYGWKEFCFRPDSNSGPLNHRQALNPLSYWSSGHETSDVVFHSATLSEVAVINW